MKVFGKILSVREELAGSYLVGDVSAGATTIVVDDVSQFAELLGPIQFENEDGVVELAEISAIDAEIDQLTLLDPVASSWLDGDMVHIYPLLETRYAWVAANGAPDDTIKALLPTNVGAFLRLGTRHEYEYERVTIEWEQESSTWVVHDVYVDQGVTLELDDLADVDTTTTAPTDGDTIVWDDSSGLWVPGTGAGGGGGTIDLEEDGSPLGAFDTIDFASGLTATNDGGSHATVDLDSSGFVFALALDDLTDVDTTGETDGDVLMLDSSGLWVPAALDSSGISGIVVQENDATVSAAATTLDFGNGLDVTESPAGEANITVDPSEIKLDDLGTPDDNTDLNASTSVHGLLRKLPGGTTTFLRGDGSFASVTSSGGGGDSRPAIGRAAPEAAPGGGNDDEFDDGSIAGAWNQVTPSGTNPGSWVERYNQMHFKHTAQGTNSRFSAQLRVPSSISVGDYIEACVFHNTSVSYEAIGLMFADGHTFGAGNQAAVLFYGTNSGILRVEANQNFGGTVTEGTSEHPGYQARMFLRLKYQAANTWRGYYSSDGFVWRVCASDVTKNFTPTDCGICVYHHSQVGVQPQSWLAWDYFRYNPADE